MAAADEPRLPRVALRPGSLGLLRAVASVLTVCCLCQLVPGATADWETVHCETQADSIHVAAAKYAIDDFIAKTAPLTSCCNQPHGGEMCTNFQWAGGNGNNALGFCSNILHCDNCHWIASMWAEVVQQCTVNYDGVDRAGGYVAYDWSPGVWAHYRIWHA